jgi:hypothetical protein
MGRYGRHHVGELISRSSLLFLTRVALTGLLFVVLKMKEFLTSSLEETNWKIRKTYAQMMSPCAMLSRNT